MPKKEKLETAPWLRLESQAKRLSKAAKELDKAVVGLAMSQLVKACHELAIPIEGVPAPEKDDTTPEGPFPLPAGKPKHPVKDHLDIYGPED